jgi:hypothetical protein
MYQSHLFRVFCSCCRHDTVKLETRSLVNQDPATDDLDVLSLHVHRYIYNIKYRDLYKPSCLLFLLDAVFGGKRFTTARSGNRSFHVYGSKSSFRSISCRYRRVGLSDPTQGAQSCTYLVVGIQDDSRVLRTCSENMPPALPLPRVFILCWL